MNQKTLILLLISFALLPYVKGQENNDTIIFKVVEQVPVARACKNINSTAVKNLCHVTEVYKYIYGHPLFQSRLTNLKYRHILRLLIEKDGTISKIEHPRSKSKEIDRLLDIVLDEMSMDTFFIAGKQRNKDVRVSHVFPLVIHGDHKEEIIPAVTENIYISDFDFIESLGVPVTLNSEKITPDILERLETRCSSSFNLDDWLWNEDENVTINIRCN